MKENVIVKILGKEYTVPFPNVGQYYRIESLKQTLTNGMYNTMLMSNSVAAQNALDMIDIEAAFTVLCPEFRSYYPHLPVDLVDSKLSSILPP